jgi:hypothetical protein
VVVEPFKDNGFCLKMEKIALQLNLTKNIKLIFSDINTTNIFYVSILAPEISKFQCTSIFVTMAKVHHAVIK